jgi:hypothetical protein
MHLRSLSGSNPHNEPHQRKRKSSSKRYCTLLNIFGTLKVREVRCWFKKNTIYILQRSKLFQIFEVNRIYLILQTFSTELSLSYQTTRSGVCVVLRQCWSCTRLKCNTWNVLVLQCGELTLKPQYNRKFVKLHIEFKYRDLDSVDKATAIAFFCEIFQALSIVFYPSYFLFVSSKQWLFKDCGAQTKLGIALYSVREFVSLLVCSE